MHSYILSSPGISIIPSTLQAIMDCKTRFKQKLSSEEMDNRNSFLVQWVKDLVLSMQQLGLLLWHKFDPWPRNFHMPQVWPKKKKKKERKKERKEMLLYSGKIIIKKKKKERKCKMVSAFQQKKCIMLNLHLFNVNLSIKEKINKVLW